MIVSLATIPWVTVPASLQVRHCASDLRQARLIAPARPTYPDIATAAGAQGTSIVVVVIGAKGSVLDASIESSSRNARLDSAAIEAARNSRFASASCGGHGANGTYRYIVHFTLDPTTRVGTITVGEPGWKGGYIELPSDDLPRPTGFAY